MKLLKSSPINIIASVFGLFAVVAALTPAYAQQQKPNVIVVFSDDVGWGDLGSYGGGETRGAPTPNLDRMAAEGARFTTWYGQASCTAGRASFITGRIPIRSALSVVIGPGDPNHLHQETPTIAEFYKKNGYKTYMSGKWHLGDQPNGFPTSHGFDEMHHFLAYYAGVYGYRNNELHPYFPSWDAGFMAQYDKLNDGEWECYAGQTCKRIIEHFSYEGLATIDNEQAATAREYITKNAKGAQPFFMYIAFMKVHQPNNPAPEWKGKSHQGNFSDSMMELDANVGKVLQAIRDAGIENNTIVVFSSDNGPWIDAWPDAGYGPFRGMKGTSFENGWRVPGIIWAPGRVPAGTVKHGMMSHMDIWPTTAAMAGLKPPPHGEYVDNNGKPIYFDGIDNSAYAMGKAEKSARTEWIYIEGLEFEAVRWNQWKFMFTAKDAWLGPSMDLGLAAVYNLQMDPGEQYDMTFNGAAPRVLGQITSSPGRYSGSDNGWSYGYMTAIVNQFNDTLKKYPNIPTIPASASIGSDLPVFVKPNMAPVQQK
jgi:arylsulfatase A-like enzyme